MRFDCRKSKDFLLENGNPSIRLRVKKEILGEIDATEEVILTFWHTRTLGEPRIILRCSQKP